MPLIFILYIKLNVFKPLKCKINKVEMRINPVVSIKIQFRECFRVTAEGIKISSQRFNPIQQIGPLFLRQQLIQLDQKLYSDGGIYVAQLTSEILYK